MSHHTLDEHLTKDLIDVHAIEVQALEQMRRAPQIAGDPGTAQLFRAHCDETVATTWDAAVDATLAQQVEA